MCRVSIITFYGFFFFFFSSRRRHTRCSGVSWARSSAEQILTSVQVEQTRALGELSNGFVASMHQNQGKIEELHHVCADQQGQLHRLGEESSGAVSALENEMRLLKSNFENSAAPKLEALERWVQQDAPQLIAEECGSVGQQLVVARTSLEAAHHRIAESVTALDTKIHQIQSSCSSELSQALKEVSTKDAIQADRAKLTEHLDAQISAVSATQAEHIECVHKLIHTAQESLKQQLSNMNEEGLRQCNGAIAQHQAATGAGMDQLAQSVGEQLEEHKTSLLSELEATVVPIVARYCVGALAEPGPVPVPQRGLQSAVTQLPTSWGRVKAASEYGTSSKMEFTSSPQSTWTPGGSMRDI
eukprot:TRINITY_DN16569_c0_g2_i2.p1 TRINITY_DN16569_c0_g2~~TRINITY_DN16569_c0_g2_i2.p1  ORF type:complete len:358 (-),score=90.86 TRINITY_DN16569_c0_g2_i2:289-1362(-)